MAAVFYATHDSYGEGWIREGASIVRFATREEAESYLRSAFDHADLAEEGLAVEIVAGYFSDCWKKLYFAPRVGDPRIAPFSRAQLYVARPGQHPGGDRYWTTPSADVLVAMVVQAS